MLPPGRGRAATKPEPTGSLTIVKTIGMVVLSRFAAAVACVVEVTITSGCVATSSCAKALARLTSAFVQRCSIRIGTRPHRLQAD